MAAPCGLDEDPTAYLALPRFNHTLDFDFDSRKATVSYALTDAPPDASWPVLVFFNGLGGHRMIAALTEGIARAHSVQILTLDKPGAGLSALSTSSHTPLALPLAHRTRFMHTALLAVLAHQHITRIALLSHSNGIFYALYHLLHLPPTITVTSWTLTGPFVPASISGARALRLAALLPAPLPNALGSLMQLVPPFARVATWSGGLLSLSAGMLVTPVDAEEREARKPAHQRGYMHRYVNEACRAAIMRRSMGEMRAAIGQEALLCLHGGEAAPADAVDGGESNSVWGVGGGATDAEVLRGAFARLAELYPDDGLRIRVVYGAEDGMVPVQGRKWLRGVLEGARLLNAEDAWKEVPDAGHDDVLFLEEVVGEIFDRVQQ